MSLIINNIRYMKLKCILLNLMFVISLTTITATTHKTHIQNTVSATSEDIITYTVKKGDTVYSIATAHNTTVEDIYRLNPKAQNGIKKGDKLKIPKVRRKASGYSSHLIEAKETLYSVSKMYNISVDELKNANAGLDENTFQKGKTIQIPKFSSPAQINIADNKASSQTTFREHKVAKGETLYSISKSYNTTVEAIITNNPAVKEGLKEGMVLQFPSKQYKETKLPDNLNLPVVNTTITDVVRTKEDDIIRVAVLLPFLDNKNKGQKEKMTEFYEGFLLGVKELKEKGYNAEIYAFDIGTETDTKKLESLLGTAEMNDLDFIVGGVSNQQIDVISRFSKKTGIKYVIPFGTKSRVAATNPHVFQATTSPSNLYDWVTTAFIDHFKDHNIIFVSEKGSDNNKNDFVSELKKALTRENIPFKTQGATENLVKELKSKLSTSSQNMIIPTSSSDNTLKRIFYYLQTIDSPNVSLFGYPEWQTYTHEYSQLHKYNTYLYSIFYLDEKQYKVQSVKEQYTRWYNKNIINSYPRFAFLGYDVATFFMTAVHKYGANFENNIHEVHVPILQAAACFERENDKGGYINTGIFFVHYKTDSSVEKIECYKK